MAEPKTESAMESVLRVLLVKSGLPRPEAQAEIRDRYGHLLGRIDLFYREQRLGIEYDGATHRESLAADNRRQNALLGADIELLRFTYGDVVGNPDHVLAIVSAAYKQRSSAGTSRAKERRAA